MPQSRLTRDVLRHASAARAFHTGLVADTHRLAEMLQKLSDHLDVMRHQHAGVAEKLKSAEASCLHLTTLGTLRDTWGETYRDLRRSVRRLRSHLKQIDRGRRRRPPSES